MTPEQMMKMMQMDLGSARREDFSLIEHDGQDTGQCAPQKKRLEEVRKRHVNVMKATGTTSLKWSNAAETIQADPTIVELGDLGGGQLYRLNASRSGSKQYGDDYGVAEERQLWMDSRASHSHVRGRNYVAGPPPQEQSRSGHSSHGARPRYMPTNGYTQSTSRQRAPSPRAAGTMRFIRDQPVAVPSSDQAIAKLPRIPTSQTAVVGNGNTASLRAAATHSKLANPTKVSKHDPPHTIPASVSPIPAARHSWKPVEHLQAEVPVQALEVKTVDKQSAAELRLSAFKDYVAQDMSFAQLEEILKHIFDPARGEWLERHMPLLDAFDRVGRAFRAAIIQICQDEDKTAGFLQDYGFVPQISEHIQAAKRAISDAHGNADDAWYERNTQYMPFYNMAKRMLSMRSEELRSSPSSKYGTLQAVAAVSPSRSTQSATSELEAHGLELVKLLHKNARAMLARRSMLPDGVELRNGVYFKV